MKLAVFPLLFACLLLAPTSVEGAQERTPATVAGILADWRARRITRPADLDAALATLKREAIGELSSLLDSPPTDVPISSLASASVKVGGSRSLPALLRLAESPRADCRLAAVKSLGLVGTDTTLPTLVTALDDPEADVSAAAEKAIRETRSAPALVAAALAVGLAGGKEKHRPALLLARLGSEQAHHVLLDHAESRKEDVSMAALQGLWAMARAEDGLFVSELLKRTKFISVRKQACLVLGRLKYKPAIDDLIARLRDEEAGVSANAYWALKEITGLPLKKDADLWELWKQRSGGAGNSVAE